MSETANSTSEKYNTTPYKAITTSEIGSKKYKRTCLGGTFDRLHDGHKLLLRTAANITTQALTIGLTGEGMLKKKKFAELIEPYETRKQNVEQYLHSVNPNITYNIHNLSEPMGPAGSEEDLEAIVVSEETIQGAVAINNYRVSRNMNPLDIIIIDTVANRADLDPNDTKLSSTSLRQKEWEARQQGKL